MQVHSFTKVKLMDMFLGAKGLGDGCTLPTIDKNEFYCWKRLNSPGLGEMMRVLLKCQTNPPSPQIHWFKTHLYYKSYIFAWTSCCRITIFMKRTFNKQIIVVNIQFQYIERIILAIKHAKSQHNASLSIVKISANLSQNLSASPKRDRSLSDNRFDPRALAIFMNF